MSLGYLSQASEVDPQFPVSVEDFVAVGLWRRIGFGLVTPPLAERVHIGQLEKSLGAELLRRTPQGVELTNIGQQVYLHAKSIVHASALMREAVSANESEERLTGKIGLSAPTGFGQLVMGPWLIEFKKKYPGIILDVRLENFIDNLVKDGVDVAIRVTTEPPPMVVARDLGPVEYTLNNYIGRGEWTCAHDRYSE